MAGASSILREFVERLVEAEGGAAEPVDPDGLDYLAPPEVSARLGLAESGRLGFGPELPDGARRIGLESDLLERLKAVLGERGRCARRVVYVTVPSVSSPERVVEHGLTLRNAVYRFLGTRPVWTRYLVPFVRYTAVSDEKRDGLMRLAVNLSNGSVVDGAAESLATVALGLPPVPASSAPPAEKLPPIWEPARLDAFLRRGVAERVDRQLARFVESMRGRQERDLARLAGYYGGLRDEAVARMRKAGAGLERERLRLDAIAREYEAKVADLRQKYAMTVAVECVQVLDLTMPVLRFDLLVKRRKGERRFHMDWNPILRELEPPACEYSFTSQPVRMVCDDALHVVRLAAHGPCAACERPYCRACSPAKCPKCGRQ
jgi:hypothetical protein